jgi:DNA-binding CsgD family transcriptional regulator
MTDRETEVAHRIEQGMTDAEKTAGLLITSRAVEYRLSSIYARFGLEGRQRVRRVPGGSG